MTFETIPRKMTACEVAYFKYHSGQFCELSPDYARLLKAHGLGDFAIRTKVNAYFPARQVFDMAHENSLLEALRAVVYAPRTYIMEIRPPEKERKKRTKEQRAVLDDLLGKIARERTHYGKKHPPDVWHQLFMHEYARTNPDGVLFFRESVRTLCGMGFLYLTPQLKIPPDDQGASFSLFIASIHQWLQENPPAPAVLIKKSTTKET